MKGSNLLPLSRLEEQDPKLAKEYFKSYKGREKILNKKVDILDCTWKDCIFFSCLNPEIIFAALELLGLDRELPTILRFPISILKDMNWCLFQEVKGKDTFTKCNIKKYKENDLLPVSTAQYFVDCAKKEEDPLIFSNVEHLLLKGELSIKEAEVIEYKSIFR